MRSQQQLIGWSGWLIFWGSSSFSGQVQLYIIYKLDLDLVDLILKRLNYKLPSVRPQNFKSMILYHQNKANQENICSSES